MEALSLYSPLVNLRIWLYLQIVIQYLVKRSSTNYDAARYCKATRTALPEEIYELQGDNLCKMIGSSTFKVDPGSIYNSLDGLGNRHQVPTQRRYC